MPTLTSYVVAPAAFHVSVGFGVTDAAPSVGDGESGADGGGWTPPVTATVSKVAVAAVEVVWLETASPTNTDAFIDSVADPTSVQFAPSVD